MHLYRSIFSYFRMVLNRRNAKVRQSIFGCGTSVTMIHVQIQGFVCVMSLFMFLLEFFGKGESSNTVRLVYRRGYSPKPDIHKLGAAMRGGSVSSSSTIKWCKESSSIVRNVNITSSIATEITNYNSTASRKITAREASKAVRSIDEGVRSTICSYSRLMS